jgi:TusA-related sulfurtransferase
MLHCHGLRPARRLSEGFPEWRATLAGYPVKVKQV